MSNYGFEKGEVSIPSKEWKKFRDNLYSKYNEKLDWSLEKALELHKKISALKKGKRNFDLKTELENLLKREFGDNRYESLFHHCQLIKKSLYDENTKKFTKPTKKSFAHKKPTKDLLLEDADLYIKIDNKTKTVNYSTDDNNHSVENAENSPLGKIFFALLDRVSFTTKTGGYFRSESEYDKDDDGFHTGGRVSRLYGKYKTNKKLLKQVTGF